MQRFVVRSQHMVQDMALGILSVSVLKQTRSYMHYKSPHLEPSTWVNPSITTG